MLTSEEYEPRLAQLSKIEIVLQKDPIEEGLNGINARLSEVQKHKQQVSRLMVEAINNKSEAEILLKDATYNYDRKVDVAFATDKNVSAQKNAEMRKAVANSALTVELKAKHDADIAYIQADAYYKSVKHIDSLLDSAKENLSRQITVIQQEINSGMYGGDEFSRSSNQSAGKKIHIEK